MRAVIKRVSETSVSGEGEIVGESGRGLQILVCAMRGDSEANAEALAARIARLRIFRDEEGKMNRSLLDTGGEALVVSQFTLAADTSRGNRPGFSAAAEPAEGERLYLHFSRALAEEGIAVRNGRFGADMRVRLVNEGPVTIQMER